MADSEFDPDEEHEEESSPFDYDEEKHEQVKRNPAHRRHYMARMRAFAAIAELEDISGDAGLNEVLTQCERRLNWQIECVSDRHTIDDILMSKYNIYDPEAWMRYKNSWFEKRLRNDMHHIGTMHSSMFARALSQTKLSYRGRAILFVRELCWRFVIRLDKKMQSR